MGPKDIEKVMVDACSAIGIVPRDRVFVDGDFPDGIDGERIVVIVKRPVRGARFWQGFVEVNALVPDVDGSENHARMDEVSAALTDAFWEDTVGEFAGKTYRYSLHGSEKLSEHGYHYVNARITFEIYNI